MSNKYFQDLKSAKHFLREVKMDVFTKMSGVDYLGIGLSKQHGYFVQAVVKWNTAHVIVPKTIRDLKIQIVNGALSDMVYPKTPHLEEGFMSGDYLTKSFRPGDYPTLQPGTELNDGGTVGAIVYKGGDPHILSCNHVLDDYPGGTRIRGEQYAIGDYIPPTPGFGLDCGLSRVKDNIANNVVAHLKFLNIVPNVIVEPTLHSNVVKYGPVTGFTKGYIRLVEVYTPTNQEFPHFEVQPTKVDCRHFVKNGDSGSIILSEQNYNHAIGMVTKKAEYFPESVSQVPAGCLSPPLTDIIKQLNINLTKY